MSDFRVFWLFALLGYIAAILTMIYARMKR
jgi:hypothetical protein